MVLSDVDIREYIDLGWIEIDNFSEELEPASYDLRVGDSGWNQEGFVNIAERRFIKIERGATVIVHPFETIKLGTNLIARFGLRSYYARQGLILLSGPQIDPGFDGELRITIFNAGTSEVVLSYLDKFATIEFLSLITNASRGYQGPYQGHGPISSDEVKMVTSSYRNFSDIEDEIRTVGESLSHVQDLTKAVLIALIIAVIGGIIVGVSIGVLQEFVFSEETSSPLSQEQAIPVTPGIQQSLKESVDSN